MLLPKLPLIFSSLKSAALTTEPKKKKKAIELVMQ